MSQSSRIFIIVSGLYLFVLTFLLLTQSHSGYSATVGQVLAYYAWYLPLWALTAVTIYFATKNTDKNWHEFAFGRRTVFWLIILFIVIGFISNFDFLRQTGCFVVDELDFSTTKVVFSIGSMLLLSAGYYFSNSRLGISLLITEFVLWTLKTLYFNCSLDLFFPGYFTMIGWTLRFVLIVKTLNRQATDTTIMDTKTTL